MRAPSSPRSRRLLLWLLLLPATLTACASDPAPQVKPWVETLRSIDVTDRRDARGRVDAPGLVYWEQRDEDVSVAVVPGVLATFGGGSADATDAHAGFEALGAAGARIQGIGETDPAAAFAAAEARHGRGNVGRPVLIPVDGKDPSEWPSAVVFPEIVVQLRPAFVDAAPREQLRSRLETALAAVGLGLESVDPDDPDVCIARAPGADPEGWLADSRRVRALPLCGGTAHPDVFLPPVLDAAPPTTPDDPLLMLQWHLGSGDPDDEPLGARVRAAWELLDEALGPRPARRPIVAVIDPEGVAWKHPDLLHAELEPGDTPPVNRRLTALGWDFRRPGEIGPAKSPDRAYHGTAAAGLVCAERGNGIGGAGVAPDARLLPVRIGARAFATSRAIRFAAGLTADDAQGADVLSLSFQYGVGVPAPGVVQDALEAARDQGRGGRGCVVVCSLSNLCVDNFGEWRGALCAVPGVVAVGRATDWDLWGQSGYGPGMSLLAPSGPCPSSREKIMDVASGLVGEYSITTTDTPGPDGRNASGAPTVPYDNPNVVELADPDHTALFGGTSASVPIVAGVAALVLAVDPDLTAAEVRHVLRSTARRIDTAGLLPDGDPSAVKGELDAETYAATRGAGCVDAAAAVERVLLGGPYGFDDPIEPTRLWPGPLALDTFDVEPEPEMTAPVEKPVDEPAIVAGDRVRPKLLVEVLDTADPVAVGLETTYRVVVTNQGSAAATDVRITITAPSGSTIVGITSPRALELRDLPPFAQEGPVVQFAALAELAAGASATCEIRVRADAEGDVRCRVAVTAVGLRRSITETEATRFLTPR